MSKTELETERARELVKEKDRERIKEIASKELTAKLIYLSFQSPYNKPTGLTVPHAQNTAMDVLEI